MSQQIEKIVSEEPRLDISRSESSIRHRRRLTYDEKLKIFDYLNSGMSKIEIAKAMDVSYSFIVNFTRQYYDINSFEKHEAKKFMARKNKGVVREVQENKRVKDLAIEMLNKGFRTDTIATLLRCPEAYIIAVEAGMNSNPDGNYIGRLGPEASKPNNPYITVKKIDDFRDSLNIGDSCVIIHKKLCGPTLEITKYVEEHCVILEKYPHVAVTDKGTFTFKQLYMSKRGSK